jgi:glutamyl-tRNA synthetase
LALFEAFGVQPPAYAHIPLILNPGGSKMSKRDEGASLAEYQAGGWLPEALVNYLCLLGWNPKDNREAMPLTEIIQQFDLPQINRSNARFDKEKLLWMNGEYMRSLSKERFVEFSRPFLESAGLIEPGSDPVYLASVLDLLQERARVPSELIERARYFFTEDYPISDDAKQKHLNNAEYFKNLEKLLDAFEKLDAFGAEAIEAAIKSLAKENGLKPAVFIHPCRAAVSGQTGGPSLYHMLEVLGQDRVIERFRRALGKSRLNAVKKGR